MKKLILVTLVLTNPAAALQFNDPDTYCETRTAALAIASFKHCKEGDLIKVDDAVDLTSVCKINSPVIEVRDEYLCVFRGSKRTTRERPLTAEEKAIEKKQLEDLVDKYAD